MASEAQKVTLYVYDLSNGLAASLSHSLLGIQVDGIWHTSIVIAGTEFYFGGGISTARAGTTPFGTPVKKIDLGETHLPMDVIHDLVNDLRHRFSATTYDLLSNNCNNFTDEFAKMLLGTGIPDHIVKLPDTVMSTPFGQMIRPMLQGLENTLGTVNQTPSEPTPPPQPTTPITTSQSEVESMIRREYAALIAQEQITPNQAAILALEKVRSVYGSGNGGSGNGNNRDENGH